MFHELENDKPFLKAAFQGFAGDGKTYTAAMMAIGLHQFIGSKKPIAIYDTEHAAKALKPHFDAAGIKAVTNKSRTLATLNQAIKWCEDGGADILIVDSLTHVWEDFTEAYKRSKKRSMIEFQDWGIIKPKWKNEFSTPFVNARVHIIFTGRAGYTYDNEEKEGADGKKRREIYKSGIKMKVENETAFEPDLLILMQRNEDVLDSKKVNIFRTATIIKDRSATIDGMVLNAAGKKKGPDFKDFLPAIKQLLDGVEKEDKSVTIADTFDDAASKTALNRYKRDQFISEIEGQFNLMGLGTAVKDKQFKAACLKKLFGVTTTDGLRQFAPERLEQGLDALTFFVDDYATYVKNCAEQSTEPDAKQTGEILADCIARAAETAAAKQKAEEPVDEAGELMFD